MAVAARPCRSTAGSRCKATAALTQSSVATIVNNGSIIGNTAGQTFTISPATFTNNGTLSVTAGTMNVSWTTFTNSAGVTAGAGTILNITPSATFTNDGTLTLGGTSHTIGAANTNWTNTGSVCPQQRHVESERSLHHDGIDDQPGHRALHPCRGHHASTSAARSPTPASTLDIGSAGIFGTGGLERAERGTIIGGTLVSNDGTVSNLQQRHPRRCHHRQQPDPERQSLHQ